MVHVFQAMAFLNESKCAISNAKAFIARLFEENDAVKSLQVDETLYELF
jgi:hypothetical protein